MGELLSAEGVICLQPHFPRKSKETGVISISKPQRLQWPRLRAFEEPTGADAQTMMPGRQSRGIHRKTRLTSEWTADDFAAGQHRRVLRAEAHRFSQFDEMF